MNTFLKKNALYGLFLSLIALLVLGQTAFALDFGDIQKYTRVKTVYDDGKFGLASVQFKGREGMALKKSLEVSAPSNKRFDTYAAYTSYQGNTDPFQIFYWPWLYYDQAYLYIAFKANRSNMQVIIDWTLYDWKGNGWGASYSTASWDFNGITLDPNRWYFAWYNPTEPPLFTGYWRFDTLITSNQGGAERNTCRFQVISSTR